MKKQYLNPKEVFHSPHFSHTVAVEGAGKLVYVSGQVSYDKAGFVVGKGDMRAQSEQVFKSLSANLKAAGAAWSDVVKLNAYMVGVTPEHVAQYREVRTRYLDKKALPASTLVGVTKLVHDDLLLEVEVVAAVAAGAAQKARPPGSNRKAKKPRR
jgi:enamine deaminase RidA (YjgF/YER057c/UK114 family)